MKRVRSIPHLISLGRKCVMVNYGCGLVRQPVAFVISQPARMVHNLINRGMFIYTPKTKSTK